MKNLKRALSFALASVMLIGMMVVGAGAADFTDAEDIVNTEAVNILNALNVIAGKEDGSYFDPTGTLTRAEAAKLIVYILHGGKDAVIGTKVNPSFTDIDGTWAEAYIEYCTSTGIIAGKGDGTFGPTDTLTGSALAKMLLVAMNYDADVFGLIGNSWEINTNVEANKAGIYEDLGGLNPSAPISRDNAAQMIWNAIQANTMQLSWNQNLATGEVTQGYQAVGATLLNSKFGAYTTDAAILKGVTLDNKGTYTIDTTASEVSTDYKTYNSFTKVADDYTGLLGHNVRVVFKMENGSRVVYGVFATDDNVVVEGLVNQITSTTGGIKFNDKTHKLETGVANITDGVYGASHGLSVNRYSHDTFKLVDADGNGKYDVAVVTTVTPAKVVYASATEIIGDNGATYKVEDNNVADDIAKDDYIAVVYNIAEDCYDITEVESVYGTVDGVKTTPDRVRVDGAWYAYGTSTDSELAIDATCTFYAVNGAVIANSATAESAQIANLVMILDKDTELGVERALLLDVNGNKTVVTVDKDDSDTRTAGEMYTYVVTDDGYKLTDAATIGTKYTWTVDGTVADDSGSPAKIKTINSNTVADDAVIFVKTNDGGKVITGKQLKNLASSTWLGSGSNKIATTAVGSYVSTINGLPRVTYAGVVFNGNAKDLGVTSGNVNYGYVVNADYIVTSSHTTYDIWTGTETVTVVDKSANNVKVGDIVEYDEIDADGYITGVTVATLGTVDNTGTDGVAAIRGLEGDYIYLDGTTAGTHDYKITSDTKYLYVDSNASKAADMGKTEAVDLVLADKYAGSLYMDNVTVLVNSSAELELIVVDVRNNMTHKTQNATRTATISPGIITNATASLSKTADIKEGDAIEITFTAGASATSAGTLTATKGKFADGNTTASIPALAAGQTYKVTVFADGTGNVTFSFA